MPESERIRQVLRYAVAGGEDDFRRHDELRSRFQEALRRRSQRAWVVAEPQPRYDEVFAKGQEWLDSLAALFEILRSGKLERNQGISEDIRTRLELLLTMTTEVSRLARVIVASRLVLLHYLDSSWTRERLIPFFSWSQPKEAAGAWQGFLWSGTINPSLWEDLKGHFLDIFDHLEHASASMRHLGVLLLVVSIESPEALNMEEVLRGLRRLDDDGRHEAARWLKKKLEGADFDKAQGKGPCREVSRGKSGAHRQTHRRSPSTVVRRPQWFS